MRPPDHSVLIDWPWRYGFLIVADDGVLHVYFDGSDWTIELLASL